MREVSDRNKPHCFELYASGSEFIKACKTDSEGKVVEGEYLRNYQRKFFHFFLCLSRATCVLCAKSAGVSRKATYRNQLTTHK